MDVEKLVSICRHELRLGEDNDIARLIREVKIIQGHSSGIYTRLSKKHRTNAWEILSGYMLTWKYVEDLDGLGSGQRFWKGETSRLDALIWPKDKKKILVGVAKIFNELQDYSMIDRQKRQSRPTPRNYQEADSEYYPSPPVAQSTITPPTNRGRRKDKQPKADVTPVVLVPDHVVSLAQDRELGEQAFSQKEEAKKAASKGSYDANTDTDEIAKESPSRKRALTPPWIPELDLHQTWPGFEYKNISKEGFRALRRRTVKIDDSEETPSRTTPMTLRGSKRSMVTADREQASAEKYSSTVPTERRRGPYLLTRHQAASAKVIDNDSPTSEDDSAIGEASISAASSSDDPLVPATATRRFPRKLQRRRLVRNREDENDPESVRRVALSSSSDDPPISATANRRWRKLQQTRLVRNRESKKGLENVPRIALSSSSDDPPIPATATRRFRKKLQLPRLDRDGEGEKGPESVRQVVLSSSSVDPPIPATATRRFRKKLQLPRLDRDGEGEKGPESVRQVVLSSSSVDPPIPATATRRFRKKLQLPRLDRDGEGEKGPESVRQVVLSSSSDDPPISAAANRRSRRKLQLTRPIRNRDGDNGLESVSPVALSRRCEQKVDFEASDN